MGILVHNADYPLEDLEELTGITIQDPYARKMAEGHAYAFHKDDFPKVKDRLDFAQEIEYIISNPTAKRDLDRGRTAYLDEDNQIVVIVNPRDPDGGTAYRPRDEFTQQPKDARKVFDKLT